MWGSALHAPSDNRFGVSIPRAFEGVFGHVNRNFKIALWFYKNIEVVGNVYFLPYRLYKLYEHYKLSTYNTLTFVTFNFDSVWT